MSRVVPDSSRWSDLASVMVRRDTATHASATCRWRLQVSLASRYDLVMGSCVVYFKVVVWLARTASSHWRIALSARHAGEQAATPWHLQALHRGLQLMSAAACLGLAPSGSLSALHASCRPWQAALSAHAAGRLSGASWDGGRLQPAVEKTVGQSPTSSKCRVARGTTTQ